MSVELILYVFPDIVKVPGVMGACRGSSLSLSFKSIELARRWLVLFFDEISVAVAKDSTSRVKSPVIAPVDADATNPESCVLIRTERAKNNDSSWSADDALFRESSWLFKIPRSDTLALFSAFWLSNLVFGIASSSRSLSTIGCQSIPEAKPVNLKSEPIRTEGQNWYHLLCVHAMIKQDICH